MSTASGAVLTESEARLASQGFFNLLKQGNKNAIRSLLDDEFLKKREKLLSNPSYAEYLKNYYKDSEFNILSVNLSDNKMIEVIFEIRSGGQTQMVSSIYFAVKGNKLKLIREKNREKNERLIAD